MVVMFQIKPNSFINLDNVATVDFIDKENTILIGYNCCDDTGELALNNYRFKLKDEYKKCVQRLRRKLDTLA